MRWHELGDRVVERVDVGVRVESPDEVDGSSTWTVTFAEQRGARRTRSRIRTAAVAALATSLLAGASGAALGSIAPAVKSATRTVRVPAGQVRTIEIPYPDALKFGGARYSDRVTILSPPPSKHGKRPNLRLVKLLSDGPIEGGSLLRVRIRNDNPPGTLPARAVVVALTRLSAASA